MMGLESVELVIAIEKHFAITIRDSEAAKAKTVQDVADLIALHRPILPSGRDTRKQVCDMLLASLVLGGGAITDDTAFAEVCGTLRPSEIWEGWMRQELQLPPLSVKDREGSLNAMLRFMLPKKIAGGSVLDLTFGQFVDAVVAHNHRTLIDPLAPASSYEILMVVVGLSSDQLGIAEFDIRPTDSYTEDLGMD